jgi:hypothetical protein
MVYNPDSHDLYVPTLSQRITVNGSFTYVAEAQPGTALSASNWRVKRIEDLGGGQFTTLWAGGDHFFNKVGTNVSALVYS